MGRLTLDKIISEIGLIWTTLISIMGALAVYAVGAVICFVRLEGKVKMNEGMFKQFQDNSKAKDEKIDASIDKLFDLVRKVEKIANNIDGRLSAKDRNSDPL